MATKKSVGATSFTSASAPQNDQQIEKRLQALEAKAHTPCGGGAGASEERIAALEARLEKAIAALKIAAPGSTRNL
jgi:hypothetical protein